MTSWLYTLAWMGSAAAGAPASTLTIPTGRSWGGEIRGYELDDEDCSLRTIKLILNKFKKAARIDEDTDNQYSFATDAGRLYILRLVPSLEEREKLRRDRMKRKEEQAAREAQAKVDAIEALKGVGI